MKKFFRNNGLSITLASLFLVFWSCQAVSGWHVHNEEEALHAKPELDFGEYLRSGHFWQATGENWESEFLQMGVYVVFTSFLFQKGSAESKDPEEGGRKWPTPGYGFFQRNSLSIVLFALFVVSFALHASGGLIEENERRLENNQAAETMGDFITGSQFWFQSFQNWQSEFLAVLAIVTLTIFLRQQGSPESKAVDEPNSKTGAS